MKHIYPKNLLPDDIVHISVRGWLIINNNGDSTSRVGYVAGNEHLIQPHGAPVISITCFNTINDQYISADDVRWEIDEDEINEIFNNQG